MNSALKLHPSHEQAINKAVQFINARMKEKVEIENALDEEEKEAIQAEKASKRRRLNL